MFVLADVYARWLALREGGEDGMTIFPVASHFSGNTAQSTAALLQRYFAGQKSDETVRVYETYRHFYGTASSVIRQFADPDYLMTYYHHEILWELRSMAVRCNYESAYTTNTEDFGRFVRAQIRRYEQEGLLVVNGNGELAVDYDDPLWRAETEKLIRAADVRKEFHRKTILSAFGNLSSGWEMLRPNGYGVCYDDGLIVDPMFDSELFMVFDLYIFWCERLSVRLGDPARFFEKLFQSLKRGENVLAPADEGFDVAQGILDSLPCDMFFGEEHLKNWLGKKFFAEQRLLHPSLRTRTYRILGMGLLDGRRMSASAGHAILTRDLIRAYGGQTARLAVLMSGGNISRGYDYDRTLPEKAIRCMQAFSDYWILLNSGPRNGSDTLSVKACADALDGMISDGQIGRAVHELLAGIPARCRRPTGVCAAQLLGFYEKYLDIFLPGFVTCQTR